MNENDHANNSGMPYLVVWDWENVQVSSEKLGWLVGAIKAYLNKFVLDRNRVPVNKATPIKKGFYIVHNGLKDTTNGIRAAKRNAIAVHGVDLLDSCYDKADACDAILRNKITEFTGSIRKGVSSAGDTKSGLIHGILVLLSGDGSFWTELSPAKDMLHLCLIGYPKSTNEMLTLLSNDVHTVDGFLDKFVSENDKEHGNHTHRYLEVWRNLNYYFKQYIKFVREQKNAIANSLAHAVNQSPAKENMVTKSSSGWSLSPAPSTNSVSKPKKKSATQCSHWEDPAHNKLKCIFHHPTEACRDFQRCEKGAYNCVFGHPFCSADKFCSCKGTPSRQYNHRRANPRFNQPVQRGYESRQWQEQQAVSADSSRPSSASLSLEDEGPLNNRSHQLLSDVYVSGKKLSGLSLDSQQQQNSNNVADEDNSTKSLPKSSSLSEEITFGNFEDLEEFSTITASTTQSEEIITFGNFDDVEEFSTIMASSTHSTSSADATVSRPAAYKGRCSGPH